MLTSAARDHLATLAVEDKGKPVTPFDSRSMVTLASLFTDHPAEVGETWAQHARVSLRIARKALFIAAAATVHALVPGWCTRTASARVRDLHTICVTRTPMTPIHVPARAPAPAPDKDL